MGSVKRRLRRSLKRAGDATAGALAVGLLRSLHRVPFDTLANGAGRFMRTIGPLFRENRIARAQLTAAFPEKSPAEIERILSGVWDNLGRMGAEFAHLDRLWDWDPEHPERDSRIVLEQDSIDRFVKLLNDGKPALIFAAHLGNWELPAICAETYKLDSAVLYRRPNIKAVNDWISETRATHMGEIIATGLDAPVKIAAALTRGAHVVFTDTSRWDEVMGVNLNAAFYSVRAVVRGMLLRRWGRIINVSSPSARAPLTGQSSYAASKAGVIGLVDGYAADRGLVRRGITVSAVAPGFIETEMTARIPLATREVGRRLNSLAQGGLPVDVAETIAFFAADAQAAVSGNVVRVCGQSLLGA